MGEIHMLHGCSPSWRRHVQATRNYVPEEALNQHLGARGEAYRGLADGSNDSALTVDDSTLGAARACIIAREAGHEVTLFVNPAQIARGRLYWFSRFDALLDARGVATIQFEGREWDLSGDRELRAFRLALKPRMMALAEDETDGVLDDLAERLQTGSVIVPTHTRTMTVEILRDLIRRGVHIGSHGWDHRDIAGMNPEELKEDLGRARSWFQSTLGLSPTWYAVPYGVARVPDSGAWDDIEMILLADPGRNTGFIGCRHWNRRDITRELHGALV